MGEGGGRGVGGGTKGKMEKGEDEEKGEGKGVGGKEEGRESEFVDCGGELW